MATRNRTAEDLGLPPMPQLPAGYEDRSAEPVGQWQPMGGYCHFIPQFARLVDSDVDDTKPSTLVIGELVEPCKVIDREDNEIEAEAGQLVLVWVTPGSKAILKCKGVKCFVFLTGEQDTGKPNPMKTYTVAAPKGAPQELVPLEADHRKNSKDKVTPWDLAGVTLRGGASSAPKRAQEIGSDDDIPFN